MSPPKIASTPHPADISTFQRKKLSPQMLKDLLRSKYSLRVFFFLKHLLCASHQQQEGRQRRDRKINKRSSLVSRCGRHGEKKTSTIRLPCEGSMCPPSLELCKAPYLVHCLVRRVRGASPRGDGSTQVGWMSRR